MRFLDFFGPARAFVAGGNRLSANVTCPVGSTGNYPLAPANLLAHFAKRVTVPFMDELPSVIVKYLDSYNNMEAPSLLACFTDDAAFEHVSGGATVRIVGKQALGEMARQGVEMFESRRQTVQRAIVSGDAIAIEIGFAAIVRTDLPNGWKKGQTVALRGASFFRLRDGKITELVDIS